MQVEAGLMCTELVRIRGHGRGSDSSHHAIKDSHVSHFALNIGNPESDGNTKQNRTRGFIP